MAADRDILIVALEAAARAFNAQHPRRTLLGPSPDAAILAPLRAAIECCEAYKVVAGKYIFCGDGGPVLSADALASRLFAHAVEFGESVNSAIDKLLRMLTTKTATGLFKVAIWGLSLDDEVGLPGGSCLLPFGALADSHMKRKIVERAKPCYEGSIWLSHSYFDTPGAAVVRELPDFPYIGADGRAFELIERLAREARDLCTLIEAAHVGRPLAVAYWFEYVDRDLEYAEWDKQLTWLLPEITPRVAQVGPTEAREICNNATLFAAMPSAIRGDFLRSMKRFTSSRCRHELIDQVLDLALAFEIADSEKGDNAAPKSKVSLRVAQLIGGPLAERLARRKSIAELYDLRNSATHGGKLESDSKKPIDQILDEAAQSYMRLVNIMLSVGKKPIWKEIEMEPRISY